MHKTFVSLLALTSGTVLLAVALFSAVRAHAVTPRLNHVDPSSWPSRSTRRCGVASLGNASRNLACSRNTVDRDACHQSPYSSSV